MSEWRGRARSILGQGVERLKEGALQWVTRISREAVESPQPSGALGSAQRPRLQRALGLLRSGLSMGRRGARRVRGGVGRTVCWAGSRIPGALLSVVGGPPRAVASDDAGVAERGSAASETRGAQGSVRSGFFASAGGGPRAGAGDPSQLRAFGRDAWTLFALWEVRAELRPHHLPSAWLELRVRALGGSEVLRRRVPLSGSFYLDDLVPGATYVVELWWTDGTGVRPVDLPAESVTLAMGPPVAADGGRSASFGSWAPQPGRPEAHRGRIPPLEAAAPPGWAGSPTGLPWAPEPGHPAGSATSAGGARSGSGRAASGAGAWSPTSPGFGAGPGSGGAGSRASSASRHPGAGGRGASGRAPTSPGRGWTADAPIASRKVRASGTWRPSDVAPLIRPVRSAPPPSSYNTAGSGGHQPPGATSARASQVTTAGVGHAPGPATPPAERPVKRGQRGRKGRARRRRALREATIRPDSGSGRAPEGEAPRAGSTPVRRGFFQDVPSDAPQPPGRRGGR